jgi:hypothetical protein
MATKIYLRSILKGSKKCLSMFDSNNKGGINVLESEVLSDSKVFWELDTRSGIKSIDRIWSKENISKVFKSEPKKGLNNGFEVQVVKTDKKIREAYNIQYTTKEGETVTIDPYIRVVPPPTNG